MKKFFKNLSWIQRLIIILSVLLAGSYYLYSTESLPFQKDDTVTVTVQTTKDGDAEIIIEDANPAEIEEEFPIEMSENEVMAAIHKMSHQKVVAEKKWGAIPLTPERVKRLMKVVHENDKKYKNSQIYIDILKRWSAGDFSSVVDDHNQVWELQGGTVGAAKGKASAEEEKEFIEKNFKVKQ